MVNYNDKPEKLIVHTEKSGTKDFLIGAVVGGVIGAAVALWLSPKSGRALREEVANQTVALKDKAGNLQIKVSEVAQKTKEKTQNLTQTISQQSSEAISKIKGKLQNQEEVVEEAVDPIQAMLEETKKAFDETEEKLKP